MKKIYAGWMHAYNMYNTEYAAWSAHENQIPILEDQLEIAELALANYLAANNPPDPMELMVLEDAVETYQTTLDSSRAMSEYHRLEKNYWGDLMITISGEKIFWEAERDAAQLIIDALMCSGC